MPRSGSTLIESIISSGKLKYLMEVKQQQLIGFIKNYRKDLFNINNDQIYIDKSVLRNDAFNKYKNLNLDKKKNFFLQINLWRIFFT